MQASAQQGHIAKVIPIMMVGPMGAGKSTIGKLLAHQLKGSFIDLDEVIVQTAGCSIPDIFAQHGEGYFRDLEHACLQKVIDEIDGQAVIAGGGGIAGRKDNRDLIVNYTYCLYLHLPVEEQYERVKHDTNRPMIHVDDIKKRLSDLFEVRDPLYREIAKVIINANQAKDLVLQDCIHAL